ESALRSALEENRLEVHYQPKVDPSGEIIGVEALARWEDPQLGRIGPDRFIPIAEEAGLISLLTLQVLRQAFEAARDWNRGRTRPLLLAVRRGSTTMMRMSGRLARAASRRRNSTGWA